jgi:hypothetical protein
MNLQFALKKVKLNTVLFQLWNVGEVILFHKTYLHFLHNLIKKSKIKFQIPVILCFTPLKNIKENFSGLTHNKNLKLQKRHLKK